MNDEVKLLLVEDEPILAGVVKETLEMKGYKVSHASNGLEGLDHFQRFNPDLCIIDIMMPQKDGLSLIEEIRTRNKHIPLIILTAKSEIQDVLRGFHAGADDYMKKPFSVEELLMRIQVLLKRSRTTGNPTPDLYYLGNYIFDSNRQELHFGGEVQRMSQREAEILKSLANHLNEITSRKEMLIELWGDDSFFNTRSMDVYITRIRKYLSQDVNVQIVNVRGRGYKLIV
ncbi:response regulator transcription factor [Pedobacter caeni]|uniref:DNA-binding response regulator, OmpR family, contains REC and winged-helix (WHTH) domain n=1 Tax=Pedobacter caeni TaxID=288992 RepID=A0A1M5B7E5_9SPHI|nr:response regulator transcription factor [Pedobacter caeni]SHF38444.1 DNA-binding response regulator, OmpR family, contains REC and winged-helix (wHTH) domain [Pedobacter caeni]